MKNQHLKNLLILVMAAFFIGTSGPLGKFIAMPIPLIIWWRSFIGGIAMFLFCKYNKITLIRFPKKERLPFFIAGVFLGAHWITYFLALKMSNVAIGMLSLFTFPVITAFLEPLFGKEKFKPIHVLLGCMILVGIYILAPDLDFENSHVKGILFGLLSAFFYAIRNLITKQYTAKYNESMIMTYQLAIITVVTLPALFLYSNSNLATQYPYVLILALMTTALGHTLFVKSLKNFSAATASIIGSVQPIFGIIIAFLFLNEIPSINTAIGGGLILGTVIVESVLSKK
ncbi:DMT family transporter [Urechidicola vernalis]|uniref:DMT family transporter n=1 Tax=Urechidicola vernalis TaxID=3075600 RepID=A0ABU2YAB4_9FLAO|nr:DMT family transporter [Urechidicola sp. P050]MDT0554185.1 DMT family transporter [Urechidicola sp. P050]